MYPVEQMEDVKLGTPVSWGEGRPRTLLGREGTRVPLKDVPWSILLAWTEENTHTHTHTHTHTQSRFSSRPHPCMGLAGKTFI